LYLQEKRSCMRGTSCLLFRMMMRHCTKPIVSLEFLIIHFKKQVDHETLQSLIIFGNFDQALMLTVSCNSCQSSKNSGSPMQTEQYVKVSPDFNPDSAYSFVASR
jgi:hypothetical protein